MRKGASIELKISTIIFDRNDSLAEEEFVVVLESLKYFHLFLLSEKTYRSQDKRLLGKLAMLAPSEVKERERVVKAIVWVMWKIAASHVDRMINEGCGGWIYDKLRYIVCSLASVEYKSEREEMRELAIFDLFDMANACGVLEDLLDFHKEKGKAIPPVVECCIPYARKHKEEAKVVEKKNIFMIENSLVCIDEDKSVPLDMCQLKGLIDIFLCLHVEKDLEDRFLELLLDKKYGIFEDSSSLIIGTSSSTMLEKLRKKKKTGLIVCKRLDGTWESLYENDCDMLELECSKFSSEKCFLEAVKKVSSKAKEKNLPLCLCVKREITRRKCDGLLNGENFCFTQY